jgi:DNA-binding NtrC family response regulator
MKPSILIVDDEPLIRQALIRALSGEGYELLQAPGGREALNILTARGVDLILSDLVMPEMDGLELLKKARVVRPESLRIVLTGHADLDLAVRAINDGAVYRFLLKPWDSFDLRVMIKLALRHKVAQRERDNTDARQRCDTAPTAFPVLVASPAGTPQA